MITLLAVSPAIPVVASLLMGAAALVVSYGLIKALESEDLKQGRDWRYDVTRINDLRRISFVYRLFQPVIEQFALLNRAFFRDQLPEVQRQIHAAGFSRSWLPEEYLARGQMIALLMLPAFSYVFYLIGGPFGVALAVGASLLLAYLMRRRLESQARYRLVIIKRRMPFLLDLLTLMMEAGATFLQALAQSVEELEGQPVSVEFGRVLTDMSMGKTRTEALESMRVRLSDDDITSVIGSIIQGEELGTPLTVIFRTQSEVLRIKRIQRAEAIAGEAGVKMLLPGVLVMASCILVILGPFVLNYLYSGFSL
jgi:tight adherence protein C